MVQSSILGDESSTTFDATNVPNDAPGSEVLKETGPSLDSPASAAQPSPIAAPEQRAAGATQPPGGASSSPLPPIAAYIGGSLHPGASSSSSGPNHVPSRTMAQTMPAQRSLKGGSRSTGSLQKTQFRPDPSADFVGLAGPDSSADFPPDSPAAGRGLSSGVCDSVKQRRKFDPGKIYKEDAPRGFRLKGVRSVSDVSRYTGNVAPYSRQSWEVRNAYKMMRAQQHATVSSQTWEALHSWTASDRPFDQWYSQAKQGVKFKHKL